MHQGSPASEAAVPLLSQLLKAEMAEREVRFVVLIGGPGTGKPHVATALVVQAVGHHRNKVRFISAVERVNALEQEKMQVRAGQIAEPLVRADLLILDQSGHRPFSASCGALLFYLLSKLCAHTSVVIRPRGRISPIS